MLNNQACCFLLLGVVPPPATVPAEADLEFFRGFEPVLLACRGLLAFPVALALGASLAAAEFSKRGVVELSCSRTNQYLT